MDVKKKSWVSPVAIDQVNHDLDLVFLSGKKNHHISNTAYPISHGSTWKPYRISKRENLDHVIKAFDGLDDISLYSHIPFCETRCYFCEYTVVGKSELDQTALYMNYLERELNLYRDILGSRRLQGFDIGGGTPSFVSADLIDKHVNHVAKTFDFSDEFEISIETTPKIASADPEKLKSYYKTGIRRVSMGIQVTQPDLLKVLGREGNGLSNITNAVNNIRQAGFTSFNVDLMYGFANQSIESWCATLQYAIDLEPEYITLYRMRYKLTRISDQASKVGMDQILVQAGLAKTMLKDAGYWANPGKNTYSRMIDSTGTSDYLTGRVVQGAPYLGIGLGSQTFTDTSISYNSGAVGKNLRPYFNDIDKNELPIQDFYNLPKVHMMAKMVAVSFYFGEINLGYFLNKFGVSFEDAYGPAVDYAIANGLMEYTNSKNGAELALRTRQPFGQHDNRSLSLTVKGAADFNGTIALFFAPSIQEYLMNFDANSSTDLVRNSLAAEKVFARGIS